MCLYGDVMTWQVRGVAVEFVMMGSVQPGDTLFVGTHPIVDGFVPRTQDFNFSRRLLVSLVVYDAG